MQGEGFQGQREPYLPARAQRPPRWIRGCGTMRFHWQPRVLLPPSRPPYGCGSFYPPLAPGSTLPSMFLDFVLGFCPPFCKGTVDLQRSALKPGISFFPSTILVAGIGGGSYFSICSFCANARSWLLFNITFPVQGRPRRRGEPPVPMPREGAAQSRLQAPSSAALSPATDRGGGFVPGLQPARAVRCSNCFFPPSCPCPDKRAAHGQEWGQEMASGSVLSASLVCWGGSIARQQACRGGHRSGAVTLSRNTHMHALNRRLGSAGLVPGVGGLRSVKPWTWRPPCSPEPQQAWGTLQSVPSPRGRSCHKHHAVRLVVPSAASILVFWFRARASACVTCINCMDCAFQAVPKWSEHKRREHEVPCTLLFVSLLCPEQRACSKRKKKTIKNQL